MSTWATRCNACGTAFRVNADQLEVSDGYVRCGRCDAVFNARSTLFDLDAPVIAPPPVAADPGDFATGAVRPIHSAADPTVIEEGGTFVAGDGERQDILSTQPSPPSELQLSTPGMAAPVGVGAEAGPVEAHESEPEPMWVEPNATPSHSAERAEPTWSAAPAALEPALAPEPESVESPDANTRMLELLRTPSAAEPAELATPVGPHSTAPMADWPSLQRPAKARMSRRGQWLGGVLALGLAAALPLQWGWIERDALRARWPALHAALNSHWPSLGHAGWQQLDGLTVVSSALKATPQGGAYQLDLVVRNGSSNRLAMPWLDLSLSDAKGKPVLRKALEPSSLGAGAPLAAGEERRVVAIFKVDGSSVAGYELGLFHP